MNEDVFIEVTMGDTIELVEPSISNEEKDGWPILFLFTPAQQDEDCGLCRNDVSYYRPCLAKASLTLGDCGDDDIYDYCPRCPKPKHEKVILNGTTGALICLIGVDNRKAFYLPLPEWHRLSPMGGYGSLAWQALEIAKAQAERALLNNGRELPYS